MRLRFIPDNQRFVNILAGLVLLALLLISYANSFQASWQYDDFGNIVNNPQVHMSAWSWDQFKAVWSAGLSHQAVSRPLAYLTFAVNHRLGGLNPFGYHLFNFVIHWLSAVLLFLFLRNFLTLPVFGGRYTGGANHIALVGTILWATHPIHVTAVTFIVQRMASLAGLFYIGGMYGYLKGRLSRGRARSTMYLAAALFFLFCGLLTKENTVMLLYVLIILEFFFIQGNSDHRLRRSLPWFAVVTCIVGAVGFLYTDPLNLLRPFDIRPYTWVERLMTQPRVIWFYLSLLAVPMTSRMTLLHDIEVSRSLTSPWTTAPAAAALVLAAVLFLWLIHSRRYLLVAYGGLFFLVNHAIEASVVNLELIYEHRNYIPSMFLFVPLAAAMDKALAHFSYRPSFQWMIGATVLLVVSSQCYTTYGYNRVFDTELSLWTHVTRRAPNLSLGYNNLGNLLWNAGQWDLAYEQFSKAHRLNRYFNTRHKGLVHHNLGLYHLNRKRNLEQALHHFETARALFPDNRQIRYQLIRTQIARGAESSIVRELSAAMDRWPGGAGFHSLDGLWKLKKGDCRAAMASARLALRIDAEHTAALPVLAEASRCVGDIDAAIGYWDQFISAEPGHVIALMALVELHHTAHQPALAISYLQRLADASAGRSLDELLDLAETWSSLNTMAVDQDKIRAVIRELMADRRG